jgi:hypothetical protein
MRLCEWRQCGNEAIDGTDWCERHTEDHKLPRLKEEHRGSRRVKDVELQATASGVEVSSAAATVLGFEDAELLRRQIRAEVEAEISNAKLLIQRDIDNVRYYLREIERDLERLP